jgi:hypothetical protein
MYSLSKSRNYRISGLRQLAVIKSLKCHQNIMLLSQPPGTIYSRNPSKLA